MTDPRPWLDALRTDGIHLSTDELLRYRELHKLISLAPAANRQAAISGAYLSKHKGRGMEFDEARHYQPGDDIRAIDWRVTARTGTTHTKVYREERERPVFVLCDLSASMQFGTQLLLKSVQAAHLTALIAWAAAHRGDKIGALIFGASGHQECKPMTRSKAVLAICHELIQMQTDGINGAPGTAGQNFQDACARLRRVARPGSLVYIISDFYQLDETATQHLAHLSRHCEAKALMVSDPLEFSLPVTSGQREVVVTDGTSRQTWQLGNAHQSRQYEQARRAHFDAINDRLEQAGISLQHIDAGSPLEQQLVNAG
ncbi:DUF58 domain-containing protein [Salinimonas chungwhensis]|uniref:DUF58 domain-containing protein n=1 Tax=Salinimonas chungwhensis TaxID=265425 RepID=UPI0003A2374F|nr:DUF58 domain-containing protein [Salinimonas chungwhensis]